MPAWIAAASVLEGWAASLRGRTETGPRLLRHGIAERLGIGYGADVTVYLGLLIEALLASGETGEPKEVLEEAPTRCARAGEQWFEAELHRLAARLALARRPADTGAAGSRLEQALASARQQEARMWELRAARGLALLWAGQGRRAETYDFLAPVYGRFTEGFETADLKDARALLDEPV